MRKGMSYKFGSGAMFLLLMRIKNLDFNHEVVKLF